MNKLSSVKFIVLVFVFRSMQYKELTVPTPLCLPWNLEIWINTSKWTRRLRQLVKKLQCNNWDNNTPRSRSPNSLTFGTNTYADTRAVRRIRPSRGNSHMTATYGWCHMTATRGWCHMTATCGWCHMTATCGWCHMTATRGWWHTWKRHMIT